MRSALVVGFLLASPTYAFALDQSLHQEISQDSCVTAGLPQDFCERVGTEAYNVDSYEWSSPEAHAQIGEGAIGTACTAANAALNRERWLGDDMRVKLDQLAGHVDTDLATQIATDLGRALHTVQDDCAHHGMPNPQHAWASLTDTCTGSSTSPDVQPDAAACAWYETSLVLDAFVGEAYTAGVGDGQLTGVSEGWTHWPARGDVCAFLESASSWDGHDARWDNGVVVPMLREQLEHALTVDGTMISDACDAQYQLASPDPDPQVDVSHPPAICLKIKVYCIGKEDAPDEPPPWETPAAAAASASQTAGCSTGAPGSPALLVAACALGLVIRRRRAS